VEYLVFRLIVIGSNMMKNARPLPLEKLYVIVLLRQHLDTYIPGQGSEGHLVLKLENEVGPTLQIQKLR